MPAETRRSNLRANTSINRQRRSTATQASNQTHVLTDAPKTDASNIDAASSDSVTTSLVAGSSLLEDCGAILWGAEDTGQRRKRGISDDIQALLDKHPPEQHTQVLESFVSALNEYQQMTAAEDMAKILWETGDSKVRRQLKKGAVTGSLPAIKSKRVPRDIKDEAIEVLRPIFPNDEAFGFPSVDWVKDCGQQALSKYRTLCTRTRMLGIFDIIWETEPKIMHSLITNPFPPDKSGAAIPTSLNDSIATKALELCKLEAERLGKEWPKSQPKHKGRGVTSTPVDDTDFDAVSVSDHIDDDDGHNITPRPSATSTTSDTTNTHEPQLHVAGEAPTAGPQSRSASITRILNGTPGTSDDRLSSTPAKRVRDNTESVADVTNDADRPSRAKRIKLIVTNNGTDTPTRAVTPRTSDHDTSAVKVLPAATDDSTVTEGLERAVQSLYDKNFINDTVITRVLWAISDACPTKLVYVFDPSYANRDFDINERINICQSTTHAILPICEGYHWTAAFISIEEKTIDLFDSLRVGSKRDCTWIERQTRRAADFLVTQVKGSQDASTAGDADSTRPTAALSVHANSEWEYISRNDQPQQPNTSDCGIFVLVSCLRRILGIPPSGKIHGEIWRRAFQSWLRGDAESPMLQYTADTDHSKLEDDQPMGPEFINNFNEVVRKCKENEELLDGLVKAADMLKTIAATEHSEILREKMKSTAANITSLEGTIKGFVGLDATSKQVLTVTVEKRISTLKNDHATMERVRIRSRNARFNIDHAIKAIEQQASSTQKIFNSLSRDRDDMARTGSEWFLRHLSSPSSGCGGDF